MKEKKEFVAYIEVQNFGKVDTMYFDCTSENSVQAYHGRQVFSLYEPKSDGKTFLQCGHQSNFLYTSPPQCGHSTGNFGNDSLGN